MIYQNFLIGALFILFYAIFSVRTDKSIISGPALALIVGSIFGPMLLNTTKINLNHEEYKLLAELALALILFSDASKTNLMVLKRNRTLPIRLLLIGLPLTILFGTAIGFMIFNDFSWVEIAILATILAPTDAALGKAVVSNKAVPAKIREALNIESGLNDGISVPILFLFMAIFTSQSGTELGSLPGLHFFVEEIGIGLLAGLLITSVVIVIAHYSNIHKWVAQTWKPIIIIALTISCFTAAQLLGGSGFIACFSGGFLYGTISDKYKLKSNLIESVEGFGDSMSLITWLIFGALIIPNFLHSFDPYAALYAILSLTIIRIVPVLISLVKTGLLLREKLFIGWFGPRGLATIVFAIIIMDIALPHAQTITTTIVYTILLSVVLHGVTANPFIKLLSKKK